MNRISVNQLSWAVVVPILLAFIGFAGIMVFRRIVRRWRVRVNPGAKTPARTTTLREVVRCWLAPTGVMAVFLALSGVFSHEFERWFSSTSVTVISAPIQRSDLPTQSNNLSNTSIAHSTLPKPGWIAEGDKQIDEVQLKVLKSELWVTEAEARRELVPIAASDVRAYFAERHHGLFDQPRHQFLSDERLADFAVKQEYLEPVTKKSGTLELPMFQLWQQIEISPAVHDEIYPAWKSAVLPIRVMFIGSVLSLMTLAANAVSLFVKLKRRPNRSKAYAAAIAGSSAAAWIVGDLLLAMRLFQ